MTPAYVRQELRQMRFEELYERQRHELALAVFHGPRCLARYHADGRLRDTTPAPSGSIPRSNRWSIVNPRATVRTQLSAGR